MNEKGLRMSWEKDATRSSEVVVIAKNGMGYGEGAISTADQLKTGELTEQALAVAMEIVQERPEVFCAVDADANDDGCGDGRPAAKVFRYLKRHGETIVEEYKKSRRRAKLFGGGLPVASSMWRVLQGLPSPAESVLQDRIAMADDLTSLGIAFGAHNDNHAQGDACGCGAIDNYPKVTANAAKYREEITQTLRVLYGDSFDENEVAIKEVFDFYEALQSIAPSYFRDAGGRQTMDIIQDHGAVIKMLVDAHEEDLIVANDIDGTTFDQRAFDALMQEKLGEDAPEVQVFAVDTWRGRMYADAMLKLAAEKLPHADADVVRKKAYADFLIRSTLAVAATLTRGDLPVFGRLYSDKPHVGLE